ncbi:hypothetical protein [Vibrio hippocampi]|uniref:Uncharacterized protein n=1 Tax=Vibrio hippocampi TaxID=654686 RepID=A0ABN8DNP0_9VIBR|nr:hypothetical protein [Vibrio hippocampi]CAH0529946.1 hypothetical protein VHP8226_03680 [Vibrio hippocampi]
MTLKNEMKNAAKEGIELSLSENRNKDQLKIDLFESEFFVSKMKKHFIVLVFINIFVLLVPDYSFLGAVFYFPLFIVLMSSISYRWRNAIGDKAAAGWFDRWKPKVLVPMLFTFAAFMLDVLLLKFGLPVFGLCTICLILFSWKK